MGKGNKTKSKKYELAEILDHRLDEKGEMEFLVSWVGFEDTTWLPEKNLEDARILVKVYKKMKMLPLTPRKTTTADRANSVENKVSNNVDKKSAFSDDLRAKESRKSNVRKKAPAKKNRKVIPYLPSKFIKEVENMVKLDNKPSRRRTTALATMPDSSPLISKTKPKRKTIGHLRNSYSPSPVVSGMKTGKHRRTPFTKKNTPKGTGSSSAAKESNEYEVELICGHCLKDGITMYKVKWLGYDDGHSSWLPESELRNCKKLLNEYKRFYSNVASSDAPPPVLEAATPKKVPRTKTKGAIVKCKNESRTAVGKQMIEHSQSDNRNPRPPAATNPASRRGFRTSTEGLATFEPGDDPWREYGLQSVVIEVIQHPLPNDLISNAEKETTVYSTGTAGHLEEPGFFPSKGGDTTNLTNDDSSVLRPPLAIKGAGEEDSATAPITIGKDLCYRSITEADEAMEMETANVNVAELDDINKFFAGEQELPDESNVVDEAVVEMISTVAREAEENAPLHSYDEEQLANDLFACPDNKANEFGGESSQESQDFANTEEGFSLNLNVPLANDHHDEDQQPRIHIMSIVKKEPVPPGVPPQVTVTACSGNEPLRLRSMRVSDVASIAPDLLLEFYIREHAQDDRILWMRQ